MKITLTVAEANHILTLLAQNKREGWYFGNREQYEKRAERIEDKIRVAGASNAD